MLCQKFSPDTLPNLKTHCRIFPSIADRTYWENAKQYNLEDVEKQCRRYEGAERKMLTASLYREFFVNGNRTHYEAVYFARREELVAKTVLTCFYNDDRYLEDIADLLWMILEESAWTLPAHNHLDENSDSLPNPESPFLDLFLAETACTLGFVYQTIGEKLDTISRTIGERIKKRVTHDAIDNYLTQNHYWWMGNRNRIDNWNPWISSNILAVSLIFTDDAEKLRRVVYKVMRVLDYYADKYPEDGACDEGASYWAQAGLSLLECLWLLKLTSDGNIDLFGEEKVKNTLTYPMKMHTGGNTFINFADCAIHLSVYSASLYKMARFTGEKAVFAFAKEMLEETGMPEGVFTKVFRLTDFMTYRGEMEEVRKGNFTPDTDCFFESIRVAVSKSDAAPEKGMLLAIKGGHNDECHNHNDVGNFIVYKKGVRFLVDSGNMVYTKETFSANRYNIWINSSKYHNLPLIDGKVQKYGEEYRAENVQYAITEKEMHFSLDIGKAYENHDDIHKWERNFVFDKKAEEIRVTETFDLQEEMPITLRFLTPQRPAFSENAIILSSPEGETLTMEFTGAEFAFSVEEILCDDAKIKESWPEGLCIITLETNGKCGKIEYTIK